MKRKNSQLQYHVRPWRTHLSATRFGPMLTLVLALLLIGALLFCILRFAMPALAEYRPAHPEAQTAIISDVKDADDPPETLLSAATGTVALVDVADATVLADPSVNGDMILFAAGASEDALDRLVRYDTLTGEAEGVLVPMQYDALHNPVEDDARIVYVDAKRAGGGAIRAFDKTSGETRLVTELAADIPVLCYETPYLLWRERTATGAPRLYACHLGTGDAVTLSCLETDIAAWSLPSLYAGTVAYTEADPDNDENGLIRTVTLVDGAIANYAPHTYVQDPKRIDGALLYTTGRHGADNDLMLLPDGGTATCIATGVIDYGCTAENVVYGRDGAVYAYSLSTGSTEKWSGAGYAQFAAASGNTAVWREMANPENPVWKYRRMD